MNATLTLIDLAGSIALLLWGVHMVQSGIQRAFGPNLRRILGAALGEPLQGVPRRAWGSRRYCRAAPRPG